MSFLNLGYGNVYRTYPQVQLQTPAQPEPLPAGDPPALPPTWEQLYTAFWRVWRPPLSPAHTQQDHPPLIAVGAPPAYMPPWEAVYQAFWRVWRPPLSPAHAQQDHAPLAAIGADPVYMPPPWPVGLQPRWWRDPWSPGHYQQNVPPLVPIGAPPAYQPPPWDNLYTGFWKVWRAPLSPAFTQQDVPALVAIGNAPVPFPPLPTVFPIAPLSIAFFQGRPPAVQQVLIIAPAFPPSWIANWAAYQPGPVSRAFFQTPPTLPVGDPPAPFPQLGSWSAAQQLRYWPLIETATRLRLVAVGDAAALQTSANLLAAYLRSPFAPPQSLPIVQQVLLLPLPVPPVPWAAALYYRDFPASLLQRPRLAPLGDPPAVFPLLGRWTAGEQLRRYPALELAQHLPLLPLGDAAALFLAPNLSAAYRRDPFPRIVSLPLLPPPIILPALTPPPQAWSHALYYRTFPIYVFEPRVIEAIVSPDLVILIPIHTNAPLGGPGRTDAIQ